MTKIKTVRMNFLNFFKAEEVLPSEFKDMINQKILDKIIVNLSINYIYESMQEVSKMRKIKTVRVNFLNFFIAEEILPSEFKNIMNQKTFDKVKIKVFKLTIKGFIKQK